MNGNTENKKSTEAIGSRSTGSPTAPPESSAEAPSSPTDDTAATAATETEPSLENLKVDVIETDGTNAVAKFQWMRIHPLTAIAGLVASDEDASPTSLDPSVVALARRFGDYRQAAAERQITGAVVSSSCTPNVTASEVTLDLRDLLMDPPLMSNAVDEILADNFDSPSSSHDDEKDDTSGLNGGAVDNVGLEEIITLALQRVEETASNKTSATVACQQHLHSSSEAQLLDQLPSDLVSQQIMSRADRRELNDDNTILLCISALTVLGKSGCSDAMGCHILQRLAPVTLSAVTGKDSPLSVSKKVTLMKALEELARTLLYDCELRKRGKTWLFQLVDAVPERLDSDLFRELIIHLGEVLQK